MRISLFGGFRHDLVWDFSDFEGFCTFFFCFIISQMNHATTPSSISLTFPPNFPKKISLRENLAQSLCNTSHLWIEGEPRVWSTPGSGAAVPTALVPRRRRCCRLILSRASVQFSSPVSPPSSARKTWQWKPLHSDLLTWWRLRIPPPTTERTRRFQFNISWKTSGFSSLACRCAASMFSITLRV